jgi:methionyl-tRNA formyltransferase
MSKLNKLVFFGNERLATGIESTNVPTLQALIASGYDIKAVVSNYTEGTSRNARPLEIAEVAKEHHISLLLPKKLKDIKKELENLNAEAAILVAYGKIIPKDIIEIFPKGIINIHPSLLPIYRGPTPIEQAIADGVGITGVSIMQLSEKMDTGPVFVQQKVSLAGNETKAQLAEALLNLGSKLLIENLQAILNGMIKPKVQGDSQATYTKLLDKKDGKIDWSKSADQYEREVKAYLGFPRSKAEIEGHEVVITKARATTRPYDYKGIIRHCKDGSTLEIEELIAPSGRTMSGIDFLRGYAKPAD